MKWGFASILTWMKEMSWDEGIFTIKISKELIIKMNWLKYWKKDWKVGLKTKVNMARIWPYVSGLIFFLMCSCFIVFWHFFPLKNYFWCQRRFRKQQKCWENCNIIQRVEQIFQSRKKKKTKRKKRFSCFSSEKKIRFVNSTKCDTCCSTVNVKM